ncbi:MAG TPA: thiamine pyrophosphate-dependent dehydrogenase E1 component subunit alpha [Candidatus Binataceae bacterium]|nr:thiamine pyrophosphate-dependent dehydrogenase E1 component subunit alpha [Candidatus Binataceae bacterium]
MKIEKPADKSEPNAPAISTERPFELYRAMRLMRRFDEPASSLGPHDPTGAIMFRGEEATSAGAILARGGGDYIVSAYRGHGHRLAVGADPKLAMAYRFGKLSRDAISELDAGLRFVSASDALAIATGIALSIAYREAPHAVCCIFGDEVLAQGAFHEALNLASLWTLPVVFVCENNFFAMGSITDNAVCQEELHRFAASYKMPGTRVDGMEVLEVHAAVALALAQARRGEGPSLVEAVTYRPNGPQGDRIALERDPIATTRRQMIEHADDAAARLDQIDLDIERLLDQAAAFADTLAPCR